MHDEIDWTKKAAEELDVMDLPDAMREAADELLEMWANDHQVVRTSRLPDFMKSDYRDYPDDFN